MDKIKTGELIREARKSKNYTQNELGDMLGVTNKAVSRWEKGESFPDIAVLENLAHILDLKIQDIVVGEIQATETTNESGEIAATELLRMANVQIRAKKKRIIGNAIALFVVLCSIIAGIAGTFGSSLLFDDSSGIVYYIMLISSLAAVVYGGFIPKYEAEPVIGLERLMCVLSIVSYFWEIIIVYGVSVLVMREQIPFGMKLADVGPFINTQLKVIMVLNVLMFLVEIARMGKEFRKLHFGYVFQMASIYLAALYGDLLHRMSSFDGYISNLTTRTVVVLLCTVIAIMAMVMIKSDAKAKEDQI